MLFFLFQFFYYLNLDDFLIKKKTHYIPTALTNNFAGVAVHRRH